MTTKFSVNSRAVKRVIPAAVVVLFAVGLAGCADDSNNLGGGGGTTGTTTGGTTGTTTGGTTGTTTGGTTGTTTGGTTGTTTGGTTGTTTGGTTGTTTGGTTGTTTGGTTGTTTGGTTGTTTGGTTGTTTGGTTGTTTGGTTGTTTGTTVSCANISSNPYTQIATPNAVSTPSVPGGLCLLCSVTNPNYVIQPDPKLIVNPTVITLDVGIVATDSLTVTDSSTQYAGGQRAGFVVASPSGLLTAQLLSNVSVTSVLNGVAQESSQVSTTLRLDALGTMVAGGLSYGYVSFLTTNPFDSLRITATGPVSALYSLNVYDACVSTGVGQTPP